MQRYFFNLADEVYPADLQGVELVCLADVESEAVRFAEEVFESRPDLASSDGHVHVEVTNTMGTLLVTLTTAVIPFPALTAIRAPASHSRLDAIS